ncbi:MAG: nucleoside hydrolase [Caldilineaceae bacterium]|nr:nucleoside hydrolase [Caldilineaceae bacterium]
MDFAPLDPQQLADRLNPPSAPVRMVLDTDTYNEIDDQFAVVYSLLSSERMLVEALYAAPFHNSRSAGAGDGMQKSYDEIHRLLDRLSFLDLPRSGFVHRGAEAWMRDTNGPVGSDSAADLIEKALASPLDDPLYVVAIGAITNVASALLLEPAIRERIVVVWLGGHARHWPDTREFNLYQDPTASRVVLDCGVPLVRFPCMGVVSHLHTTLPEVAAHVKGRGAIGDYLYEIYRDYREDQFAYSKQIWDIAPVGWLVSPGWAPMERVSAPILTEQLTWDFDESRHKVACARYVDRDSILRDLFSKLGRAAAEG